MGGRADYNDFAKALASEVERIEGVVENGFKRLEKLLKEAKEEDAKAKKGASKDK